MVGKRDEGVGVAYNPFTGPNRDVPTEFLGFMAPALNFSNDDIAHINQHAEMCTVSGNEIVMDPGSCPSRAKAASSAGNLPAVTITAPSGYKVVYKTVEEKRTFSPNNYGQTGACGSYKVSNASGSLTLAPGDSVTLRPQKASVNSTGTGGTMYRKKVQLISVTAVDTTKTCPDGSIISSGQQCPSTDNGDNGGNGGGGGGNGGGGNGGNGGGYIHPTGMDMNTLAIIGGVSAVAVIGVVGTVLMLKKK